MKITRGGGRSRRTPGGSGRVAPGYSASLQDTRRPLAIGQSGPVRIGNATLVTFAVLLAACGSGDNDDGLVGNTPASTSSGAPRSEPVPHDDTVSDDEASAALQVALDDDRVRMGDDFEIVSVGRVGPAPYGAVVVRIVLRGQVAQGPADQCAIGGHSGNVTGLVYLVSDPPATVEALSPEWDASVSCLGNTRSEP
jgi:hypothetical protein